MADIVAYWTFNDYDNGTLFSSTTDSSGNGYTVTRTNPNDNYDLRINSSEPGVYGNHLQRNNYTVSNDSKSSCNDLGNANIYGNNMTISFWGTHPSEYWRNYLSLRAGSSGKNMNFQRGDKKIGVYYRLDVDDVTLDRVSNDDITLETGWHHFVLTVDPNIATLYMDGKLIGQNDNWTFGDDKITNITFNSMLVTDHQRSSDAKLDEVQIYNNSITAEQVSFLYNNPSLYLATGYQRDITADGNWSDSVWNANQLTDQAFANSSAVQLDAENSPTLTLNQNVTVNSLDFNGSMTIDGSNTITLNGEKRITVAGADDVVTISAPISPLYDNTFTKAGAGTLVFTEANAYTGNPTVSDGTLRLTDNAVTANGVITLEADDTLGTKGTLEYNVASGEKTLIFSNAASVIGNGDILKTGEGRLKINTEQLTGDLHFTADNFVVASGPVDIKGYMYCNLSVEGPDAVFSPGNSVGDATFGGGFILKEGATLLIEQDASGIDTLTASSFNIDSNSIIDIAADSLQPGASYDIIFQTDSEGNPIIFTEAQATDDYWNNLLTPESAYYWNLSVSGNIVRASVDANAVPEPSTWALLLLGAAGLLYVRKRTRK